jgi:FkbM family methyltransferase
MALRAGDSKLVYDVGMHDGDDTAAYLGAGNRVVAIEADPQLVEAGQKRFAKELAEGRLKIENVCIAPEPGVVDFWICEEKSVWNSLDRKMASRDGKKHHAIQIGAEPFASILERNGTPWYLKIDIEGADEMCLEGLRGRALPEYLSIEAECAEEGAVLTEDQQVARLDALVALGYNRFKLIRQTDFHAFRLGGAERFGHRLAHSMAYGRLARLGLAGAAKPYTDRGQIEQTYGKMFRTGTTGPWATGLPGSWLNYNEAKRVYLRERQLALAIPGAASYSFWCDWHARREQ